ncbi:patatin-like phospholipase family protein [Candidatus Woesearchaeota archaeon]|nr:patatin-like phospholipase family protein [Candidatus Woesearchaeota archaeon]
MGKKAILYLGGGGMMGVFGAGVVTGLQKMDLYDSFEAVCGCSAGTFNGAYFLTHQSMLGSRIYWEDLTDNFLLRRNIPFGAIQRIWNGYVYPINFNKIVNAMNLDRLIWVAENKKVLNIDKLRKQKIPLYVKLLNTNNMKIEYIDLRKGNIIQLLSSSCSTLPYYFPTPQNRKYVDAAIKEPLGLDYLLKLNPNRKIVAVFNLSTDRNLWHYVKNIFEGTVANAMFRSAFYKCFMQRESSIRRNLKIAKNNNKILLVCPSKNNPVQSWTLNRSKLKQSHKEGVDVAKIVKIFLN